MTRFLLRTKCLALLMAVTLLLLWSMYWRRGEGDEEEEFLKRVEDLKRKRKKIRLLQPEVNISDQYLDMKEFSYHHFMKKRNEEIAEIKAKKARKGKIFVYKTSRIVRRSSCVPFKTLWNNTRICVHSKRFDPFISSHIRDLGTWEPESLVFMATALRDTPDMHLLDIGCNVGTFTLFAALMGRKVVAIDPIKSNLFMVHSSLKYAGLRDNVILLLNAVSEFAEPVRIVLNKENIGGSSIEPVPKGYNGSDAIIGAILMDDLVRVVNFKKVFLKIDIEQSEVKALRRASRFFEKFDVRYVMMEWTFYKHNVKGHEIIEFMESRRFRPFVDVSRKTVLDVKKYYTWPDNVIWIKRTFRTHV